MSVHRLALWQHDIAERCRFRATSIYREVLKKIPELPLSILDIPNHVLLLRAVVDYCMADERRAEALLSVVREDKYLYRDLEERGPWGKTVRSLKQFRLTTAAEAEFGDQLRAGMVDFDTFNPGITEVNRAFDIMIDGGLLLPEEEFMLFQNRSPKSTAEEKVSAKMQMFRDVVLPNVSAETRNSMMLVLAVCNLHIFGIKSVSSAAPYELVETVNPTAQADDQRKASNQEEPSNQEEASNQEE